MIYSATGHRDIKDYLDCKRRIRTYLSQNEVTHVIIGCAQGFDTAVGWACVGLHLPFDMYLPFEGSYYDAALRKHARSFIVVCEGGYTNAKYWLRDKKMVDDSHKVIAWYDGRTQGGTYITYRYAKDKGKDVINLYERKG